MKPAVQKEDPVLRSSRREAFVVLGCWACAFAYTVGYSYFRGYNRSLESLTFVFGIPDWVFWGVVVPWLACTVFSFWFAFAFMTDEWLGQDQEEEAEELRTAATDPTSEFAPRGGRDV